LEASQDVGAHEVTQRRIWGMRPIRESLDKIRELLGRTEQSGIDEVEDRPKVTQAVLNRRSCESDARVGVKRFRCSCLLSGRVLDRLRLVENGEPPTRRSHPTNAPQRPLPGDHEIGIYQPVS